MQEVLIISKQPKGFFRLEIGCLGSDKNVASWCIFHSIVSHISRSEQWWPIQTARSLRRGGESHTPPQNACPPSWPGSWSGAMCPREAAGRGEASALSDWSREPPADGLPRAVALVLLSARLRSLRLWVRLPFSVSQDRSGGFLWLRFMGPYSRKTPWCFPQESVSPYWDAVSQRIRFLHSSTSYFFFFLQTILL